MFFRHVQPYIQPKSIPKQTDYLLKCFYGGALKVGPFAGTMFYLAPAWPKRLNRTTPWRTTRDMDKIRRLPLLDMNKIRRQPPTDYWLYY